VNDQLAAVEEPSAVDRAYLIDVVTHRPPADHPLVVLGVYDEDYVKVDGAWVCTGYDDIKAITHDTERFSSLMPKSRPIVRRCREG
jgi:hypothetical protein